MSTVAGWDRTFFDVSSRLADPFCWTLEGVFRLISPLDPKKFNNYSTPTQEFAYRVFTTGAVVVGTACIVAFAPFWTIAGVVTLGLGSKVCRVMAGVLQKNNYTHVRGTCSEKFDLSELKVMTWNLLGLVGGLHYSCGGTRHWRYRIDEIVKKIEAENPDVLLLQEIFDTAFCEALIAKLNGKFAHFYCHLGTSSLGIGGGCMVLTKCPVKSFSNLQFTNSNWKLNRCFSILEIGNSTHQYRIVGTHLQSGNAAEDAAQRKVQFGQMMGTISKLPPMTTIVAGDLNIDRDTEGKYLEEHLTHGHTHNKITCTNRLDKQWKDTSSLEHETLDYISVVTNTGKLKVQDSRLVEAFDETYNTKTALSDHHGVVVTYTQMNSKFGNLTKHASEI